MSLQATCPITIYVVTPSNKDPVRVIECQAVVYLRRESRQVEKLEKPEPYYYLDFGKYHLRLRKREDESGFEANVSEHRVSLIVFPETIPN